jgi:hypothetical protein
MKIATKARQYKAPRYTKDLYYKILVKWCDRSRLFIVSGGGSASRQQTLMNNCYIYRNNSIVQASGTILLPSETILPASQSFLRAATNLV